MRNVLLICGCTPAFYRATGRFALLPSGSSFILYWPPPARYAFIEQAITPNQRVERLYKTPFP